MQAFGVIYGILIAMMLPGIAYFIPSWEPVWIKIIPTHPLVQSFKEVILANGDVTYIIITCLGFLITGLVLFRIANKRFEKTLGM